MFNVFVQINWLSVLCAFIPYFMLGALWFTLLFPRSYHLSLGKAMQPQQKPELIFIFGPALCCLVITIATAVLLYALQISTLNDALILATIIGAGYLVANTVNIAINPNIPRPLLYGLISGAYHMTGITIVCIILVLMK
ncbi:DUF1761 domain-containing protein [Dyadobacter luteus]|uniref:DUF1761 domain-containing protein n=1 Tax=Dyadobacter luteus TaxID=2259619 RepID=A0A3D8YEK3_9BACT|nr:DUF1761 domain-containing protein [Dyadobacter luteus]REA63049.1 DUF1761 domain-containing protein [Dyadobacter luteus]